MTHGGRLACVEHTAGACAGAASRARGGSDNIAAVLVDAINISGAPGADPFQDWPQGGGDNSAHLKMRPVILWVPKIPIHTSGLLSAKLRPPGETERYSSWSVY